MLTTPNAWFFRSSRYLQLSTSLIDIDRRPVACTFYACTSSYNGEAAHSWDRRTILSCLMHGARRQHFFDTLENQAAAHAEQFTNSIKFGSPTPAYHPLQTMVNLVAKELFARNPITRTRPLFENRTCPRRGGKEEVISEEPGVL